MNDEKKCVQCPKPAYAIFEWRVASKGVCEAMLCRDCAEKYFGKGGIGVNTSYIIKEP